MQTVTCLVEDNGKEIERCPNCNFRLIEDDDDEYCEFDFDNENVPEACIGCSNYHGVTYGENLLICGIHAYGFDNADCPDFS